MCKVFQLQEPVEWQFVVKAIEQVLWTNIMKLILINELIHRTLKLCMRWKTLCINDVDIIEHWTEAT